MKKTEDLEASHVRRFVEKAITHINQKILDREPSSDAKAIVKSVSDNKRRPN